MIATTTVDLFRDTNTTDVDSWGDEQETPSGNPVPHTIGIPMSITERTQRIRDDNSGLRPVTYLVGRCRSTVDVKTGDRLRDRKDGAWYEISKIVRSQSPLMAIDTRMELERTMEGTTPVSAPVVIGSPAGFGASPFGGSV